MFSGCFCFCLWGVFVFGVYFIVLFLCFVSACLGGVSGGGCRFTRDVGVFLLLALHHFSDCFVGCLEGS